MNLGLLNAFSLPDGRIQALQMTMDSTEEGSPSCPACIILFSIKCLQVTAFTTRISSSQVRRSTVYNSPTKLKSTSQVTASHTLSLALEVCMPEALWSWPPRATLAQTVHRSVLGSCRGLSSCRPQQLPAAVL